MVSQVTSMLKLQLSFGERNCTAAAQSARRISADYLRPRFVSCVRGITSLSELLANMKPSIRPYLL